MSAPDVRSYLPLVVLALLIVGAIAWAEVRRPAAGEAPVASLEEVQEQGVVYLEDEGIFLVAHQGRVLALMEDAQHVGDNVLFCPSSGLFESPAHGEKFDLLGRYVGGPAATDMDRADVFAGTRGVFLNGRVIEARDRSRNAFDPKGPFCDARLPANQERPGFFEAN